MEITTGRRYLRIRRGMATQAASRSVDVARMPLTLTLAWEDSFFFFLNQREV